MAEVRVFYDRFQVIHIHKQCIQVSFFIDSLMSVIIIFCLVIFLFFGIQDSNL